MDLNKKSIGSRINLIRLSFGDNMREFGERISEKLGIPKDDSISDSIVSRWEKGVSIPSPDRLKVIADLGKTTVEKLLYGKELEVLSYNTGEEFENARQQIINKILLEEQSFINNKTTLIEELDKQYTQIESDIDKSLTLIKTETDEEKIRDFSSQISQGSQVLEHLEEAKLKLISNPEFKLYIHNKVIYLIVNKDELTVDDVKFNASQYDNLIVRKNGEEIVHLTDFDNAVLIDTIKEYHDWNTSIILTINAWFKMIDYTQHI